MAGPQEIPLTSTDIDALLTGYRWDTNDLTFSFPDSRWWYVLDAVLNELDPLDVVEAFVDWLDDPVGGFIDALGTAVLGDFDAGVIAVIALNGFRGVQCGSGSHRALRHEQCRRLDQFDVQQNDP